MDTILGVLILIFIAFIIFSKIYSKIDEKRSKENSIKKLNDLKFYKDDRDGKAKKFEICQTVAILNFEVDGFALLHCNLRKCIISFLLSCEKLDYIDEDFIRYALYKIRQSYQRKICCSFIGFVSDEGIKYGEHRTIGIDEEFYKPKRYLIINASLSSQNAKKVLDDLIKFDLFYYDNHEDGYVYKVTERVLYPLEEEHEQQNSIDDESFYNNMKRSVEKSVLLRNATISIGEVALGKRKEIDFSHIEDLFEFLKNDPILSDGIQFFEDASKMLNAAMHLNNIGVDFSEDGEHWIPLSSFCFEEPLSAVIQYFLNEMQETELKEILLNYFNNN